MNSQILIVVVLYKQRLSLCATYNTLLKHTDLPVLIYDNSPETQVSLSHIPSNWIYYHNPLNIGLSAAYNFAADIALQKKYKWILLTDQDTTFEKGIIDIYLNNIGKHPEINIFAPLIYGKDNRIISPFKLLSLSKKVKINYGLNRIRDFTPINSGLLINLKLFFKIGGYNNNIFLDFSDVDFIWRLKSVERYFYLIEATCNQAFSNDIQDKDVKLNRFRKFCQSLLGCNKQNKKEYFIFLICMLKRCISLSLNLKTISPFIIIIKTILRK